MQAYQLRPESIVAAKRERDTIRLTVREKDGREFDLITTAAPGAGLSDWADAAVRVSGLHVSDSHEPQEQSPPAATEAPRPPSDQHHTSPSGSPPCEPGCGCAQAEAAHDRSAQPTSQSPAATDDASEAADGQ